MAAGGGGVPQKQYAFVKLYRHENHKKMRLSGSFPL